MTTYKQQLPCNYSPSISARNQTLCSLVVGSRGVAMTSFLQAAVSGCRIQLARRAVSTFETLRFSEKQANNIFGNEEHDEATFSSRM